LQSLRDCDGKVLQGHACAYTTRLIAEMPCINKDGFCLAALWMSYVSAAFWQASYAQL
jgi:hypothetical protein